MLLQSLEVYKAGPLSVVAVGGREVLDHLDLAECRDELVQLIQTHRCQTLAIDLTGVQVMPTGLLGLLASIQRLGVEVRVYNACAEIREVLQVTNLDRVLHLHDVPMDWN